ncbi:MAG: ABC transporter permease [Cytophagales bacterium]
MIRFVIRRIFYGSLVVIGVLIAVFFIFHVLPGDPVAMIVGQRTDVANVEIIKKELGLDKPLIVQLGHYINDVSLISIHENNEKNQTKYEYTKLIPLGENVLVAKRPYLRRSFQSGKRVDEIIWEHMEGTFWLTMTAMLFATVVGIIFGVFSALKQNSFWDHTLVVISILGISVPSFVAAILVIWVFAVLLGDFTGLNVTGQLWVTDPIKGRYLEIKNLILPAFTLGLRPLAIIVQLTRGAMLEVLSQDYIRTARAKGLTYYRVIIKHALKNALNPVITAVSGWLASLMAGAFFIELVFNWKGLGLVAIKSVDSLDFPVVMGCTLFVAVVFVVVNILVDILYAAIDPRVRLE